MQETSKLKLRLTTSLTFDSDDIKDTITSYGENFKIIEKELTDSVKSNSELVSGEEYKYGKRMWNSSPLVGDHVGWINVREGVYAPEWKSNKSYAVGDLVRAKPDNGNIYKAVVSGKSMVKTPNFLTNKNVEFYDASGNQWMPSYNYNVDDVVFSTDGTVLFYYVCETSGLSDVNEPLWNTIQEGTTHIDGTVTWRKEKTIKWKQVGVSCNFRPFGKIE